MPKKSRVKKLMITGKDYGHAFNAMVEFIGEHQAVAMELVGDRHDWIRGRGKKLTRRLVTVRERLVVTFPPAAKPPWVTPAIAQLDRRRGGRRAI